MKRDAAILVVDDDAAVRRVVGDLLRQAGYEVEASSSAETALALIAQGSFDLLITDLRMPEMDGFELLQRVAVEAPDLPVIMLSAHGSVPIAVEAMRAGAADFVLKPFDRDALLYSAEKALAARPARPPRFPGRSELFVGSKLMRDVDLMIDKAAKGTATVLIRGDSGTGKELIARALHERSPRRDRPFVQLHCAALPETLLESELFGYQKGAFTGAVSQKPGRIELADGGTLFLDEIGDISPMMQVKILRVLQEKEVQRLGDAAPFKVDVRFVAATHQNLEKMITEGTFREDLYYRLNVVPLFVPSLGARREEIAPLARRFCARAATANQRDQRDQRGAVELDEDAIARLVAADWPGNVRQLENFIERLVVLTDGQKISGADVARELERDGRDREPKPAESLDDRRREAEKDALLQALERSGGNKAKAARILGISRRMLYYKIRELGI